LFYNNGKFQLKGLASGINVVEADAIFNIQTTMLAGNLQSLNTDLKGIIIGKGVAEKMNVGLDDNISVTSSWGVVKVLNIIGIFSTDNKATDESKSYINIKTALQLLKEGSTYVTDIYASVINPDSSVYYD
jgi:lipoprotein-releasing system permease protein